MLLTWRCLAIRDAGAGARKGLILRAHWPAHDGVDYVGNDVEPPEGVEVGTAEEYERLRIEAGWPKMGAELTEKTIPAETGIVDRAVSFTKGCFTGQELVARIDSRGGNVPRHLCGIEAQEASLAVGAALTRDGKQVGTITSASGSIGLAYVSRDVEMPADLALDAGTVRAIALPFPS